MPDFKKLVTGFLILAAITSSSAFIFSDISAKQSAETARLTAQISAEDALNAPSISANAFVEPIPEAQNTYALTLPPGPTSDEEGFPAITPTSNLTQNVVQILANKVVRANPMGPQQDENGQLNIITPDVDTIFGEISRSPMAKSIKIPDWDAEAAKEKIIALPGSDRNDLLRYGNAVSDAMSTMLTISSFPDVSIDSPRDIAPLAVAVNDALKDLRGVPVPQSALSFHKSLLTMLVYQRGAFGIVENAADDPIKATLIMQAEQKKFNLALLNLRNESENVKDFQIILSIGDKKQPGQLADIVNSIFGVQTAHAQYFETFSIYDTAYDIFDTLMKILISLVKSIVINVFMQSIITWVQGGGTPLFITDWKSFLQNTANQAAGIAIGTLAPGLCSSFGPLITIALSSASQQYNGQFSSCTLSTVINNITSFYNNFQSGGWRSYVVIFQGSNSVFAAAIDSQTYKESEAKKDKDAAQNEGISSKGFLSQKKCPANYIPSSGRPGYCVGPVPSGTNFVPAINTTPGSEVGAAVAKALDAPTDNLTSQPVDKDSWAGILSVFIGNLINALLTRGIGLL